MHVVQFFGVLLVVCFCLVMIFLTADMYTRRQGEIIVGKVVRWERTRIPGFGRVILTYTKRGRTYMCVSNLIANSKKYAFRPESMRRYILHKYPKSSKMGPVYVATVIGSVT